MLFDRIIRLGGGFLVMVLLARYLGPESFGWLSYSMAVVAMVTVIAGAGLNDILVKHLVELKVESGVTIGTALLLQFIASLVAVIVAIIVAFSFQGENSPTSTLIVILTLPLILHVSCVARGWFESRLESRYVVLSEIPVFIVMALLKLALIFVNAPLMLIASIIAVEAILMSIAIIFVFLKKSRILPKLGLSLLHMSRLLKESFPLFLSGVAIIIYMRTDQIMIAHMVGMAEVGVYSAALLFSESWYVLPIIFAASVFPGVLRNKLQFNKKFRNKNLLISVQHQFDCIVAVGLILAVMITLVSPLLVVWFFGHDYVSAIDVLQIHIWTVVFVSLGVLGSKYMISIGLQKEIFNRTAICLSINVLLNFLVIPRYGVTGAAFTTLFTHFLSGFMIDIINTKTRPLFWIKFNSLLFCYPRLLFKIWCARHAML